MLITNFVGRWLKLIASIGLLIVVISLGHAAGVSNAQTVDDLGDRAWDLGDIDQRGQFTFYDSPAGASLTGKPLEAGDFNGDGCGDLVIAA
ncbi:MAG: FG-GAP repeat protein, partial [Anaerolineae bacterium]|nr:FG-GAP repeat protein [Anaerolineae bacterium]